MNLEVGLEEFIFLPFGYELTVYGGDTISKSLFKISSLSIR